MQGLGALEYVLFGTDAETLAGEGAAHRCAFGLAVAGNLSAIASAIDAEWALPDGFSRTWSTPGPDNALYRTEAEALTELVDVFIHGLEQIRDVRLKGFLGAEPKDDKPKQVVFWRSGATVASLAGNVAGLQHLFAASGLREAMSEDNRWIADSILAQFANAAQVLDGVAGPVEDSLGVPERRAQLAYFETITSGLSAAFAMRLAPDLGLSAGFSSLDGD
jgi:predicted lipoprotein